MQGEDNLRRHDDRILRGFRLRSVATQPSNHHVNRGRTRHRITGTIDYSARFHISAVVQCDREVGFRKTRVEVVGQHRSGAVNRFLRRLSDQNERALPLIFQLREHLRRAQHIGDVNVVPASVHHADILARVVLRLHGAGVRQAGFLFHRQRVQVSAHQHGGSIAVLHHRHDAIAGEAWAVIFADAFSYREAERAQLRRKKRRGLFFPMRKLRRGVQHLVSCDQLCDLAVDDRVEGLLGHRRNGSR